MEIFVCESKNLETDFFLIIKNPFWEQLNHFSTT